jgi:hypothetical protein
MTPSKQIRQTSNTAQFPNGKDFRHGMPHSEAGKAADTGVVIADSRAIKTPPMTVFIHTP